MRSLPCGFGLVEPRRERRLSRTPWRTRRGSSGRCVRGRRVAESTAPTGTGLFAVAPDGLVPVTLGHRPK